VGDEFAAIRSRHRSSNEYPVFVKDLHAEEWEALARRAPYFCLLTHEGHVETRSTSVATEEFFETGEADIASLLSAIASILGHGPPLNASLDFGCGAGRLTLPLARRSNTVVACDVAPTMLAHARQNAADAGLRNVTFIELEELSLLPHGQFNFVCALLVFQYIPVSAGCEIVRNLLDLLAPSGVAALQVCLEGRTTSRTTRARFFHRARTLAAHSQKAYTDANVYDEQAVRRAIDAAGARLIGRFATRQDGSGTVLIIDKPATATE